MNGQDEIIQKVSRYYSDKLRAHGPNPRGVDWNSAESQSLRFEQLLKVVGTDQAFSLLDFGCGYGALLDYLRASSWQVQYLGFDIAAPMVEEALRLHEAIDSCDFTNDWTALHPSDYAVASGIFNVKQDLPEPVWEAYVLSTLDRLHELSHLGFAFNVLTSYCDRKRMRPDLYYADPCHLFDYCKRRYARSVALLHDYELYEFTLVVRKTCPQ